MSVLLDLMKLVVLVTGALILTTGISFAASPEDWTGTWHLFDSKAHPNTLPNTLAVREVGDCAAQQAWRCFSATLKKRGESRGLRGQIVVMRDRNRNAVFHFRSSAGGGRTQYDAHIYVGRRYISGSYKHVDARVRVPAGHFFAIKRH